MFAEVLVRKQNLTVRRKEDHVKRRVKRHSTHDIESVTSYHHLSHNLIARNVEMLLRVASTKIDHLTEIIFRPLQGSAIQQTLPVRLSRGNGRSGERSGCGQFCLLPVR